MADILMLVHRIPYPPNKGDKIRSHHLLKHLAKEHRVHLGSFVDDLDDLQYVKQLEDLTASQFIERLNPRSAKYKSLSGLLNNKPLTLPYYASKGMQQWVDATIERNKIRQVVVYSSSMAQFVEKYLPNDVELLLDFVDVDSDKWAQYARSQSFPYNKIYAREADKLKEYEGKLAQQARMSFFVSEDEAKLFRDTHADAANKVDHFYNGVDLDYFDPGGNFDKPFTSSHAMVFTGAMDYWANVDAVVWFADKVLPLITPHVPDARFVIVGRNPSKEVRALGERNDVTVTGGVPDVRPYLAHAKFAVAPLRIARGIQNKVLEALAMDKAVVCTPQAVEGLMSKDALAPLTLDEPQAMAQLCVQLLHDERDDLLHHNWREYVSAHYAWDAALQRLDKYLKQ